MKSYYTLLYTLSILLFAGCEQASFTDPNKPGGIEMPMVFTSVNTRGGGDLDEYGNEYNNRNLKEVPDTVGVFIDKIVGMSHDMIIKNEPYQISGYESNNYILPDSTFLYYDGDTPPAGDRLCWYKTTNPIAYWDGFPATYKIFAYAPFVETNGNSPYYSITDAGVVTFKMDNTVGIPVDFIYAASDEHYGVVLEKDVHADSLHMNFKHKLSKLVFKLRNDTENAVTCFGVKYEIEYPVATFNLITGDWNFTGSNTKIVVERFAQYEIFSKNEVTLPDLTTLLFPTHAPNWESGTSPGNVVMKFQVCLNNRWYDMTNILNDPYDPNSLNLEYNEGTLIELTFNCKLNYGVGDPVLDNNGDPVLDDNGDPVTILWNIFVATFDSFEDGGRIDGTLM